MVSRLNTAFRQLAAAGLTPTQPLGNHQQASLLRLNVGTGYEYWYGLPNFYTITRYNHSTRTRWPSGSWVWRLRRPAAAVINFHPADNFQPPRIAARSAYPGYGLVSGC